MARVAGRNRWIAVPVGILCAAVVGALVWLAAPMIPVSVAWVGDTLRDASARQAAALDREDGEVRRALAEGGVDCRAAYPDSLWSELTWRGGSLLDQSTDAPPTGADALIDALGPDVVVTCAWRSDAGAITTAFTRVGRMPPVSSTRRCAVRASRASAPMTRSAATAGARRARRGRASTTSSGTACGSSPRPTVHTPRSSTPGWRSTSGDGDPSRPPAGQPQIPAMIAEVYPDGARFENVVSMRMPSRQKSVRPSVTGYVSFSHVFSQRVPPSGV